MAEALQGNRKLIRQAEEHRRKSHDACRQAVHADGRGRPHQSRSPARPSALVRTNAHGCQTGTPVRCYDARDCPEEGSEPGIPSHTALSRSAQAEMLLAVLGRSPHSLPGAMLALYVRSMAVCPCGTRPDSCRCDAWSHVRFEDKIPLLAVLTR